MLLFVLSTWLTFSYLSELMMRFWRHWQNFSTLALLVFWTRQFLVLGACPVHCGMFRWSGGFPTLDAWSISHSLPRSRDNQKCLHTLSNVHQRVTSPLEENHYIRRIWYLNPSLNHSYATSRLPWGTQSYRNFKRRFIYRWTGAPNLDEDISSSSSGGQETSFCWAAKDWAPSDQRPNVPRRMPLREAGTGIGWSHGKHGADPHPGCGHLPGQGCSVRNRSWRRWLYIWLHGRERQMRDSFLAFW